MLSDDVRQCVLRELGNLPEMQEMKHIFLGIAHRSNPALAKRQTKQAKKKQSGMFGPKTMPTKMVRPMQGGSPGLGRGKS